MLEVALAALFAAAIGVVLLLWGYRSFLILLPVFGFFAGFWLGAQGVHWIFGDGFLSTVTGWVAGVILGILAAIFSYLFYELAIAVVAGVVTLGLTTGLLESFGLNTTWVLTLVGLAAGVLAVIAVLRLDLQRYLVMALTAIAGANAILLALLLVLGRVGVSEVTSAGTAVRPVLGDSLFWLAVWVALVAAGVWFQSRNDRRWRFEKMRYVEGWG
jgi:hypothetical protein